MANVEAVLDLILARLDRFQATNDNLVSRIEKIENLLYMICMGYVIIPAEL